MARYPPNAHRDPTVLRRLYLGRGLSLRAVGDRLDVSHTCIVTWLARYGIERRPAPEPLAEARAAGRGGRPGAE